MRSRLTHSMEVQQIGRFIVHSIFERLENIPSSYGLDGMERAVESLVEIACLMHDMGNPPFGHCGEDAINRWFEKNLRQLSPMQGLIAESPSTEIAAVEQELCHFDGNAQAIRLIHSLHRFNLTYSQAAAYLSTQGPAQSQNKKHLPIKPISLRKSGFT
nr:HD domain-containing protein [Enterovibrio coralii]